MRRIILALMLALVMAAITGGTAFAGFASAKPKGHVVRPGESIQAAVDAAKPGDTITVLGGVHHESVVIRKDGLTLQGVDTSLEPPTKSTSPCDVGFGPPAFCILGDVNFQTNEVSDYVEDVSIIGFTVRNFRDGIIAIGARDAKFVHDHAFNNGEYGITAFASTGTQFISNVTSGAGEAGIYVGDSPRAQATIADNETYGNLVGVLVRNAFHGRIAGNEVHNNCVGMWFLADEPGPAGGFDVAGNTVTNNTRACAATEETPPLSGIGIALVGARDVELQGNHIIGNVPSGPTGIHPGGVVVTKGFGGTAPTHNTVVGNTFLRNGPDIFWDKSGSGNRFVGNMCKMSKPRGVCKR
jgi:nitrous oxidase accessory protein NosD